VIISVFTEAVDRNEAQSYYDMLGMSLQRMDDDAFVMADGWRIHRFTSTEIAT
jgi:hypothetical protein